MARKRTRRYGRRKRGYRRRVKRFRKSYRTRKAYIRRRTILTYQLVSGSPVSFGTSFQLNNIGNADLVAMFDQYKLCAIKLRFLPIAQTPEVSFPGTAGAAVSVPMCYGCVDYTDASAPPTSASVMEYDNHKVWRCDTSKSFYFKPRVAMPAVVGAGNANSVVGPRTYLDTANTQVTHFGFKIFIEAPGFSWTSGGVELRAIVTYYIGLKCIR